MDIPLLIELDYMDWFDEVWLVYVDEKDAVRSFSDAKSLHTF